MWLFMPNPATAQPQMVYHQQLYLCHAQLASPISGPIQYSVHDIGMILFINHLSSPRFPPKMDGWMDGHLDVPSKARSIIERLTLIQRKKPKEVNSNYSQFHNDGRFSKCSCLYPLFVRILMIWTFTATFRTLGRSKKKVNTAGNEFQCPGRTIAPHSLINEAMSDKIRPFFIL